MSKITVYSYDNLPSNDNLNSYSYCLEVKNQIFIQTGKMIAYYGSLRFEALGTNLLDILVQEAFNAPLYIHNFVVVMGQGKLILGDRGHHIASYDLQDAHLTVKSRHVLGFESSLQCYESTLPGYLTFKGTGQFIASSNGAVHFIDPPARVDEEALLGWADAPTPCYHYDYHQVKQAVSTFGTMTGISRTGEEKQVDFTGKGTVLIQSSEQGAINQNPVEAIVGQLNSLSQSELYSVQSAIQTRLQSSSS